MRAASNHAPIAEPWMGAVRSRGTINAIVPPANGKSVEILDVANQEAEGRTTPFERIELPSPEEIAAGSEPDIDAPPHLPDAPESRWIAGGVRRLTRVAKYELTGKIGHGSFGVVYTARDTELDREVALKVLNPSHHSDDDALHRFMREARAAARIAHPGIVTVHDFGRYTPDDDDDELAYIAMERLSGESLTQRLDRTGCLRPAAAAEVARQVASALDAAHRADVLHRDLKPDNVFLVPDPAVPSGERVKVLDFGLAKIGSSRHTKLGSVFGTPLYMSPEQCRSATEIDARSDIYALGCILFELLTGHAPFEGAIYTVLECHLREEPRRVAALVRGIPPALDVLVAAMLEKDPADRPQTMEDVARSLEEVIAAPSGREEVRPARKPVVEPARKREAPLELDEADQVAIDAIAKQGPRFPTFGQDPRRRARRRLALIAALSIGIALAAALSLMVAHRRAGGDAPARAVPSAIL